LPDKLTPRSERLNPVAVAVNDTSSAEGDQAKPIDTQALEVSQTRHTKPPADKFTAIRGTTHG